MTTTPIPYDPALFLVERALSIAARAGTARFGVSRLGSSTSDWAAVPGATFDIQTSYTVNENGTLIYEAETAAVSLSRWDDPGADVLRPGDRVRASYGGVSLFFGTVDTTTVNDSTQDGRHRVDWAATLTGFYASALSRTVTWHALPAELAYDRIRRWVTVQGW